MRKACLSTILGTVLIAGCGHDAANQTHPSDPLLLCKAPVVSRSSTSSDRSVIGPREPESPPLLLAEFNNRSLDSGRAGRQPVTGIPTRRSGGEEAPAP